MWVVSALFSSGRSEYRAERPAGRHLSGRMGSDAVADRCALRPHWAQGYDCRGDATAGRRDRAVATAPRVWVVGRHDGFAWTRSRSGLSAPTLGGLRGCPPELARLGACALL